MTPFYTELKHIDFDEIREESLDKPLILSFLGNHSGASFILSSYLEELAKDFEGQLHFYSTYINENSYFHSQLDIPFIPCILILNRGNVIGEPIRLQSKKKLGNKFRAYLLENNIHQ